MVWTDFEEIRLLTGLTETDINDENVDSLIESAQKEVLLRINQRVIREKVEYIDSTRKNEINGTNTTFYIKNWKGNYISDKNYDLTIDTNDVAVYSVSGDGTETTLTVSSLSYSDGSFTLSTAPNNVDLFISYVFTPYDPYTPEPVLKLATEYLASAYCYMRLDSGQKKKIKFGNVEITNSTNGGGAYSFFLNKYADLMRQLDEGYDGGALWGESKVLI